MAKIIIALFLFFPSLLFAAVGDISFSAPRYQTTLTSTPDNTVFKLYCPEEFVLERLGTVMRLPSAGNVDIYVDNVLATTTYVDTAAAWRYWPEVSQQCTGGDVDIRFDTPSTFYSYITDYSSNSIEGPPEVYYQNASSSAYSVFYAGFSLPLTAGGGGGGGGGSNIYVGDTISGMVSEWECTTSGDTTNCAAISTSSIGMYNGPNFQEWLFVGGVIIFLLSFMFWGRISFKKPE